MFITPIEILDMLLMIGVVGFIFMDVFKVRKKEDDILQAYLPTRLGFNWKDFWFAVIVVAPAILLHELGHKMIALSFGLSATFHAAYIWLLIGVVLKLIKFPFIFFVPAYVSIAGANIVESAWVGFAGPGVNLLLFIIAFCILKLNKKIATKEFQFWTLTKSVNLFLFIFNMIPIPGFDGFTVFSSLWKIFGL